MLESRPMEQAATMRGVPRLPDAPPLSADEVLTLLAAEYGPITWRPRYAPVSELVFTILSQHTSDVNAQRAFDALRARWGSWDAVVSANVAEVATVIRSGGLAQQKAPRIQQALREIGQLRGDYDLSFLQELPLAEAKAWLRSLPGVGPKTAAIVLCFALGMPAMPVDTHIYRVARRLGLVGPKVSTEAAHALLEAQVSPEEVFEFHVYLITHGRRVCKAPRPRCHLCVLSHRCPSSQVPAASAG